MQIKFTAVISVVLAPIVFASCSDNSFNSNEELHAPGRSIAFNATEQSGRGASAYTDNFVDTFLLADESDSARTLHCETFRIPLAAMPSRVSQTSEPSQIEKIGVIADASWFEPRLMNNDLYTRDNDGVYRSTDIRYWIDDESASIDFYAFAPYLPEGLALPAAKGATTLTYTVPTATDDQADLMLAVRKGVAADYGQSVGLAFKHLLAGVRVNLTIPSGAEVTDVSLSGLTKSATLDFAAADPVWTPGTDRTLTVSAGETGEFAQFMVLPQTITPEQPVNLSITVDYGTDGVRTYSHTLTSSDWTMGINTLYNITITNYSFQLTEVTPADAHYVIYKTNVEAKNIPVDKVWTLTASASDEADVTVQNQADLNSFAQQGFWTDKIKQTGQEDVTARGTNSLTFTGSGTFPIAIFMPENAAEANRDITLNIHIDGKTTDEKPLSLTQLHPAWTTSGFGWEQTDDIEGQYGFKWNLVLYYGYLYTNNGSINHTSANNRNYCQQVIDNNGASSYAEPYQYSTGIVSSRWAIKIDYGKLSDPVANDNTDGLTNTKNLFNYGGSAATNSFVFTVQDIKKTESGHENEVTFRLGDGSSGEAPKWSGNSPAIEVQDKRVTKFDSYTAVGECMKKNRYNLLRTISSGEVSYAPTISDADIVWYMPAVGQFNTSVTSVVEPIVAASCWSSTCVNDRTNALLGNGDQADRLTTHSIRAVRNHP